MILSALIVFAAILSPSTAADYRYTVPPPEYASLIGGEGIGDSASFGVVRYTDIAFLENALREFTKVRHDIFYVGRTSGYRPTLQITNTLTRVLVNPYTSIPQVDWDSVNYSASYSIPDYLDEDKQLSAAVAFPANFDGSYTAAYPIIANVASTNGWILQRDLFSTLSTNRLNRPLYLSTITNAYWSLAKLHKLKFLNYEGAGMAYSGFRVIADGTNRDVDYDAEYESSEPGANVQWEEVETTSTNWYGNVSCGYFQYVGYHYSHKTYDWASVSNSISVSPMESTVSKFELYSYFTETSAVPQTVVLSDPIAKIWTTGYQVVGPDMSWQNRIASFKRVSLFKVERHREETFAATGASFGGTTNESATTYVLLDTSNAGDWLHDPVSNSYVGAFDNITRGLVGLGSSLAFLKGILSAAQLNDLNAECANPRVPQSDGYGYADYTDSTERTIWYRVSYMWSFTTILPAWSCTFDGK